MQIDLHFITALFYLGAAVLAWWPGLTTAGAVTRESAAKRALPMRLAAISTLLCFAVLWHGFNLSRDLFAESGFNLNFAASLSLITFGTLAIYVIIGFSVSLTHLVARYLAPLAVVVAVLPIFLPAEHVVPYGGQPLFKLHFIVAITAYVLFTIAALHALLMTAMEHWLHQGDLPPQAGGLPPLIRMERWLFRLLLAAFVLLTATLVSGVFFSEALFGKAFKFNHKTVFAIASWLIFAWLLFGHWRFGWRGKKAIRLTLIGFVALLLAYIGSKFVLQVLLGRI
ncbi:MAG: cytochrome c biogenesis protein CcsA [Betaproteobacteria bacterium]|nr:cytochrome c biogenesis protein CcsA [Betaproteobacteria bacterium]